MQLEESIPTIEAKTEATETLDQCLARAARERAARSLEGGNFREAREALEEAEKLDAEPLTDRIQNQALKTKDRITNQAQRTVENLRSHLPKFSSASKETLISEVAIPDPDAVEKSISIVNLYSKIGAAAGLLPGLLNFGAILAVQVTMVWKISSLFGHRESKEKVRGSVLSLVGSILPAGLGHSAGLAIAAIPAIIAGAVVYFLVTPVLAYALTRAVGNTFIMHFESGGTLLSFDPKAFGEYFLKEFQKAGGTVKVETPDLSSALPV